MSTNKKLEQEAYLEYKAAMSVIFIGYDKRDVYTEGYTDYLLKPEFLETLLDILENNTTSGIFDDKIRDNILNILAYIRNAKMGQPDVSEYIDIVNKCLLFLNRANKDGAPGFYRSEYFKRKADIIPVLIKKVPFLFGQIDNSPARIEIDESIEEEYNTLISLSDVKTETEFVTEDALTHLLNPNFLNTINATIEENPEFFLDSPAIDRAIHVLNSNLKIAYNISDTYEAGEDTQISTYILKRTKKTLKRLRNLNR